MSPHVEKQKAIILKRTKYGEADLILNVLSPEGGKISCVAKAALKSRKRFGGGVLEPTHFVEMILRPNPRADALASVEEARLIEGFDGLRTSFDRLDTGLALVEMIDRIAQAGDSGSHHLFDLLGNGLRGLQKARSVESFRAQFGLKLLYHQGVLEVEPWMGPYLKAPLASPSDDLHEISPAQQRWVHEQIETYLKTAERF